MSQLITLGSELIRINPQNTTHLQYSYNQGRSWLDRYIGSTPGRFLDLQVAGTQIIALTAKGTYYFKDSGRTWLFRSK